jgi:Tol biopolymer transport system component
VGHTGDGQAKFLETEGNAHETRPLLESTQFLTNPKISPDGRWVAVTTGAPPGLYVYVQSLQGPPGRWQISTAPGRKSTWTKEGREIVYEGMDGRLMAVDIDTREGFHAGTPRPLFQLPLANLNREVGTWSCDASGERFVLITPERNRSAVRTIEVVTDFQSLVSGK